MEETKKNAAILSALIAAPLSVMVVMGSFYIFTSTCTECPAFDLSYTLGLFSNWQVIIFLLFSFVTSFALFYFIFTMETKK